MTSSAESKGRTHANVERKVSFGSGESSKQLFETALTQHQAGNLSRARALYEQFLTEQPAHADALHFLGLLSFQSGDPRRAADLIGQAIAHKRDVAPYHDNLGTVLEAGGHFEAALDAYQAAAALGGDDPDRSFNKGVVLERLNRPTEAESSYREAIRLRPEDGEFHYNLANLLKARGDLRESVTEYRAALEHRPDAADALNNLGNALQALGRTDEAIDTYRRALRARADDPLSHLNLANALHSDARPEEAAASFRRVIELDSDSVEARLGLARALSSLARFEEAVQALAPARRIAPGDSRVNMQLAAALRWLAPAAYRPDLAGMVEELLSAPEVQAQDLASIAANQLRLRHDITPSHIDTDAALEDLAGRLASDKLFTALLTHTINVDPELEAALVALRRRLLSDVVDAVTRNTLPRHASLASAIARQCYINEYVFVVTEAERQDIERLGELVSTDAPAGAGSRRVRPAVEAAILGMSMYLPVAEIAAEPALDGVPVSDWSEPLRPVVARTLLEPREEAALAESMPSVGSVSDPVSRAVMAQYEQNPYPRWLGLPSRATVDYAAYLHRRFPHFEPPTWLAGPVEVLAAGCGTGQEAAAIARARTGARVTGLDLSRPSLAYATRMSAKLGIGNVSFCQGDLLDAPTLGRQFQVVECAGVLHHMSDAIAGWRALIECLVPHGVIKLGLYSRRARDDVRNARAQIAELGLRPTSDDIRSFRARVLAASSEDPIAGLRHSEDLYTLSACRDLLFHVHEVQFSLPEIGSALDALGLELIGLELPADHVRTRYLAENPGDPHLLDLAAWDRFEARHPDTFSAMFVFWCQKRAP